MTLKDFLDSISASLGDFHDGNASLSYQSWSQKSLLNWYNEARCLVASFKPSDFTVTKIMKLQPGSTQQPCCSQSSAAMEFVDARGGHISYIKALDNKGIVRQWRGPTCSTKSGSSSYKPTASWKMDSGSSTFEIHPPVPATGDFYVKIHCIESPSATDIGALGDEMGDCKHTAAIGEWILFKALSGETDTQLLNNAQIHYKAFMDLLGMQHKYKKEYDAKQSSVLATISNGVAL